MASDVDVEPGRQAPGENGFTFPWTLVCVPLTVTSPPTSGPVRPEDFDSACPQVDDLELSDVERLRLEVARWIGQFRHVMVTALLVVAFALAAVPMRPRCRAALLVRLRAWHRRLHRAAATATSPSRLAATLVVAPGAPSPA